MWSHRAVQDEPGFSTVISPWKSLVVHSSTLSLSPIMLWVMQFSHPLSRNYTGILVICICLVGGHLPSMTLTSDISS